MEKSDKYYLSNVIMVNINIINHADSMYPWYDVMIIALYILVFIPVTQSPVLSWEEYQTNFNNGASYKIPNQYSWKLSKFKKIEIVKHLFWPQCYEIRNQL